MFKIGEKVKLVRPTGGKGRDYWLELEFSSYIGIEFSSYIGKVGEIYEIDNRWYKVEGMGDWYFKEEWLSKTKRKIG